MLTRFSILFSVLYLTGPAFASHWKYDNEESWAALCLTGKKQSPIALNEFIATKKDYHPFNLVGYGQINTALLKNNGHSAEVRLHSSAEVPTVTGGGLIGTYKLDHLHFHWQSEHTMSNYRFPLELHLVHYNEKYSNLTEAAQHTHGIAVLGVLFDLSPDDDEDFKPLLEIIASLKETTNEHKVLTDFSVKNFVPRDKAGFYRYEGSLTTPGCNEGVIWTLFTSTLPISKKQVKIFEAIQTEEKTTLTKNYRSLQPLNGREVYLRVSPIRENNGNIQTWTFPVALSILCNVLYRLF
ncbi:putative carbonic anhydrase 3 isoform X1 [Rhynchophorus ferrugineus]|uniref:putative carbonic anhydrase 3 isoform X1 n=1 Tax=Rhynchophorus ferrugineus TaxID=354439 RepID=UPI003FCE4C42